MKYQGREQANWEALEKEMEELEDGKVYPKSDKIKEAPLIKLLKPLLDKLTEEDLKIYQFQKNAKEKVQFRQYPETKTAVRQIFDNHKNIFSTVSQIDAQAHYMGVLLLQYLFIVKKDIPLSKTTIKFLKREGIRNFRGQLEKMVENLKESCDFYNKKLMSEKAFREDLDDFIDVFDTENKQKIAENLIESLINAGELKLSMKRINQRKARNQNLKVINSAD